MANQIDRPGTFRGKPRDWGVSETKNGYPQFVMRVQALEYFDEESGQYVPWSEYDQEITGYFVLFTKDKDGQWAELLNAKQIKKVFGWTGLKFEDLAEGKFAETIVLFRVENSEYNGSWSLKLTWLDTADANPVKQLPKYDTAKLAALTSKMGGALAGAATPPAPASAKPATPPKRGKAAAPKSGPAASPPDHPAPAAACAVAKPVAPSTATPPPASPAPAPAVPSPTPAASQTPMTKDLAWTAVNDLNGGTEEKLAEVWIAEATKIGRPEEQFTAEDWMCVKNAVLKQTSKF
jgi:hypothetical protein